MTISTLYLPKAYLASSQGLIPAKDSKIAAAKPADLHVEPASIAPHKPIQKKPLHPSLLDYYASLKSDPVRACECPRGTRLPDGCERVTYASEKGQEFPIAAKPYPDDPQSRRIAVDVKTGKELEPQCVLKKTPAAGGFVWMRAEHAGLMGGGEPSFCSPEEACATNDNVYVVALAQHGPFEVVDRSTNEQKGNFWVSATEEGDTVSFPSIESDSDVKGATDIAIWHIAKNSDKPNMKIECVFNSDLREKLKSEYGMQCDDATLHCTGDRQSMLEVAEKRLKNYGWTLNG